MKGINEYLAQPLTRIKLAIGLFMLGVIYATVNSQINILEIKVDKIESLEIGEKLSRIETDISRIKDNLNNNRK